MTDNDFLELADLFLSQLPQASEALHRTVVSRAYYGVYHLASTFLGELGFAHGRDHGLPPRLLMVAGDNNAREAGKLLNDLQGERVKADYDLASRRFLQLELAKEIVHSAHEAKRLLEACRAEPARSLIKSGIEAWQRRVSGKS
jgi:uncharacterized protein (UPF0332 family)